MADETPTVPPAPPAKPSNRRATGLITAGVVLLLAVGAFVVVTASDGGDPTGNIEEPEPGAEGPDSDVVLAAIGAATGTGSLALGIADYARNSMRYARERRRSDADWRDRGGYL